MDITDADISLLILKGLDRVRSGPFPVFGFLDEIKEKWAFCAVHDLEFSGDESRPRYWNWSKLTPFDTTITPDGLIVLTQYCIREIMFESGINAGRADL